MDDRAGMACGPAGRPVGGVTVVTEQQLRAGIVAAARSQVGYNPGKTYSVFGAWYGWPTALWCAAFATCCVYAAAGDPSARQVLGLPAGTGNDDLAQALIGHEGTAPNDRGYIWTVALRARVLTDRVDPAKAKPGDLMFFKYPTTGDRNNNVVNHVDVVEANHADRGYLTTIGGNTPRPGTGGDPSNGRGVWRHTRWLSDRYIEGVYTLRWSALTPPAPPAIPKNTAEALVTLGYPATPAGVRAFQAWRGLTVDGIAGPITQQEVVTVMSELVTLLKRVDGKIDALPARVAEAVWDEPVDLTKAQMTALATGQSRWPVRRLFALSAAHRVGLTFQRTAEIRSLVQAVLGQVGGDDRAAMRAAAEDLAHDTEDEDR